MLLNVVVTSAIKGNQGVELAALLAKLHTVVVRHNLKGAKQSKSSKAQVVVTPVCAKLAEQKKTIRKGRNKQTNCVQ